MKKLLILAMVLSVLLVGVPGVAVATDGGRDTRNLPFQVICTLRRAEIHSVLVPW
jgi:hypothetical protein